MKLIYVFIAVNLLSCNENMNNNKKNNNSNSPVDIIDTARKGKDEKSNDSQLPVKSYSNERFKDVTVEKIGEHKFTIQGKGQIFEANLNWVVEDGHSELQKGFQMTDAGAPEWGEFKFSIEVQKQRASSTLTLILFESSPEDGSRQHELPIILE